MRTRTEMPVEKHFPEKLWDKYEIHQWKHACAILKSDFPNEWKDLIDMLSNFHLLKSWIVKGGGNKTELAKWIDDFSWQKKMERETVYDFSYCR
jgi:hypothetical protein